MKVALFSALLLGGMTVLPALAEGGGQRGRGILSDGLPRYSEPLRPAAEDLKLKRPGERLAEALAAYAIGVAAEEVADYERALEAYQKALELDASNTELAVKVALTLAQRKQIPQGIDILKDAEKAAPKDVLPPLCLSQIYDKFLNKPQLAERYAQKALRLDPTNVGPYLALYSIYSSSSQPKKAAEILKKAADAPTEDPQFWIQLAEARIAEATSEQREQRFPEALVPEIVPLLKKALKGAKGQVPTIGKIADIYVLMRQPADAIPLYEEIIKDAKGRASDELHLARYRLAQCLLAVGRSEEGEKTLVALIKDAPTRLETYELLSEWYMLHGAADRAIAVLQQALEVDGSQAKYHLRIAQLQLDQEKHDDAVKTLLDTRRQFPQQAFITYALAQALLQGERYDEALKVFGQALQEGHYSNDEILSSEFYFGYGMAAERSGNLDLAAQCLRRAIEIDPDNAADAYNYLGYMWADEGVHLEEALELIQLALRKEPENGAYLDSLGWVYYRMGKHDLAIEYLRKAIERMIPAEAVVFDHLGDALHAAGQAEEARENWQKALELEPDNAAVKEKLAGRNTPAESGGEAEAAPEASKVPAVMTSSEEAPQRTPAP